MPTRRTKITRLNAQRLAAQVIRRLLSISDAEVLLHEVCKIANDALGADEVSLMLLDKTGHELVEHEVVGKKLRPTRVTLRLQEGEGVASWVAQRRVPAVVADVRKDKRYFQVDSDVRSEAAVPILAADRLLGVLNFESKKVGYFQKGDLALLGFLASQIGIAIRMVELDEAARRWQERVAALHNLTRLGGGVVPLETMLHRVVETVRLLCGGHYAAIFQGDYEREELVLLAQSSASPIGFPAGSRVKFKTGLMGKAFEVGETVNVRDVRKDPMYLARVPGVLCEACIPLRVGDACVGILDCQAANVGEFSSDEVMFLETVARFLSPALHNASSLRH